MKPVKFVKRALLAGIAVHAWATVSLKPSPREMLDLNWHLEVPIRMMGRGLAWLLPSLYERWGERGVKSLQFVFYQVGLDRASLLQEYLRIDPHDARSLGRVLDYEDGLVGVRGIWTEECRGRATKEERYCPMAGELAECPEVCTKLMMAMEAGTFSVINPDIAIPELTKLLSTGDDCCLGTFELPYLGRKEARVESPQATHGEFPPVLKVPGLQWRLIATGLISTLKALFKLATSNIDDVEMHWYEFFRYQPPGTKE